MIVRFATLLLALHLQGLAEGAVLAAELESQFVAIEDAREFMVRPTPEGGRYHINSFAFAQPFRHAHLPFVWRSGPPAA